LADLRRGSNLLNSDSGPQSDIKLSRSQAKIDENFANYFFKPETINKCFIMLKCKGLQKSITELERGRNKAQGVATLPSRPCLKNG